jgi:hypothetical protein
MTPTTPTTPAPDDGQRDIDRAESLMLEIYGYENKEEMYEKSGHTAHDDVDRIAAALAAQRRKEDQVSERLDGLLKELVALAESWERIEGGTTGDIGVVFHGCAIQLRSEISALQKTQPSNDPLPFSAIRAEMEREP